MEPEITVIRPVDGMAEGANVTIGVSGDWRVTSLIQFSRNLHNALDKCSDNFRGVIDIRVDPEARIDSAILRKLVQVSELQKKNEKEALGPEIRLYPGSESQSALIKTITNLSIESGISEKEPKRSFLQQFGYQGVLMWHECMSTLSFVCSMLSEILRLVTQPGRFRYRELVTQIDHAGLYAVPICALVTFLIGVVVTYLMGNQLQTYGASIFVVDGVAIAMCRELSPILVAIIVAGRSGSAFAAQLGSMRLNQEVEALQVMGLSSYSVLIIPRILALMLVMPILIIVGDIFGILGGMFIANIQLEVSPNNFIERLNMILPPRHFFVGLWKGPLFALFIASIGCRLGLSSEANSISIGLNTTKSVVQGIVSVILLNALIAVILTNMKI